MSLAFLANIFVFTISLLLKQKTHTIHNKQKKKEHCKRLASLAKSLYASGSLRSPKTVCKKLAARCLRTHVCAVCRLTPPVHPQTFYRVFSPPQAEKISDNLGFYTKFNDPPLVLPSLPIFSPPPRWSTFLHSYFCSPSPSFKNSPTPRSLGLSLNGG